MIHNMLIPDPFFLKTVNNFNASLPFGLYNIFYYLIYHSTDYDKQGLAAYQSFEDYRLLREIFTNTSFEFKREFMYMEVMCTLLWK